MKEEYIARTQTERILIDILSNLEELNKNIKLLKKRRNKEKERGEVI